jgi:hypothetical protein
MIEVNQWLPELLAIEKLEKLYEFKIIIKTKFNFIGKIRFQL